MDERINDSRQPGDRHNGEAAPGGPGLKKLAGVWLGKTLMGATRLSGRGGTTLPGRAALVIAPEITAYLGRQLPEGSLVVTGTNGKTTTSHLLTGILSEQGLNCVHNQSGSNMTWGVASALIAGSSWRARMREDFAVMEADEGAFPEVVRTMRPRGAVVTNIFRDQLDRFGELDHIQKIIQKGLEAIPAGGFHVLNADDPSLAGMQISWPGRKWYYGIEMPLPEDRFQDTARDIKSCPYCHRLLHYDQVYFAHLGRYRCSSCDFERPAPDVKLTGRGITANGEQLLELDLQGKPAQFAFPLVGTYNLYNALAAVTGALALGVTPAVIGAALGRATPSFGRMEQFTMRERTLLMILIKNPVGANEALRTLLERGKKINLLIAINDRIADGTDVSWLWDVDFEQLAKIRDSLSTVVVTGIRAWDMAVRLKYAGINPPAMQVEENTREALLSAVEMTTPGELLFILPTYTAMLEIRRILNRMGVGRPYWEEKADA